MVLPTILTVPKEQNAILTGQVSPRLSCLCIYKLHLNICRHATSIASLGLHLVLNGAHLETGGKGRQRKQERQLVSYDVFLLPILFLVWFSSAPLPLQLHYICMRTRAAQACQNFHFCRQLSRRDGRTGAEAEVFSLSQRKLADSGFH